MARSWAFLTIGTSLFASSAELLGGLVVGGMLLSLWGKRTPNPNAQTTLSPSGSGPFTGI
ncbi:MAG: hypothetical protein AAF191_02930 [Verrucomicrobiota bacterium]